ncbi:hypothetical protein [Lysinibacillus sp. NPDC093688]|uniref:hypothetical protein n=1 Tax=Lysinibacillus sp. NPDC093688 TaxID=3390577 RepID=UPI003CFDE2F9
MKKTIAKSQGVASSVFTNGVKSYESHDETTFVKRYTSYSPPYKLDVSHYMNEHETSIKETAALFNIPPYETLRNGN